MGLRKPNASIMSVNRSTLGCVIQPERTRSQLPTFFTFISMPDPFGVHLKAQNPGPIRSAEHVLHEDLLMTTSQTDVQILSVCLVPPCSNRAALNDMIMDHVWACVASWYGPTIVLGELNQAPENLPAWKLMEARGWCSVSTISQNKLGTPDTILVDPRLVHAVKDCGVQCDSPFLGHRPIWIRFPQSVESSSQFVPCATGSH